MTILNKKKKKLPSYSTKTNGTLEFVCIKKKSGCKYQIHNILCISILNHKVIFLIRGKNYFIIFLLYKI